MLIVIKKYIFHIIKTKFCGFIIKLGKFSMDLKKIEVIINWQKLSNIINLKLFLKFCNYY